MRRLTSLPQTIATAALDHHPTRACVIYTTWTLYQTLFRLTDPSCILLLLFRVMTVSTSRIPLASHNRISFDHDDCQQQDLMMIKQPSQPLQAFASLSMSSTIPAAARDTKADGRSLDDSSRHADEEETPAFRQRSVWTDSNPDLADLWTLKRATPIMDENDDEDYSNYQSPTKKSRVQMLAWSDSVETSEGSHCLEELFRAM